MISMTQTLKLGSGLIDLPTAQPSAVKKIKKKYYLIFLRREPLC